MVWLLPVIAGVGIGYVVADAKNTVENVVDDAPNVLIPIMALCIAGYALWWVSQGKIPHVKIHACEKRLFTL